MRSAHIRSNPIVQVVLYGVMLPYMPVPHDHGPRAADPGKPAIVATHADAPTANCPVCQQLNQASIAGPWGLAIALPLALGPSIVRPAIRAARLRAGQARPRAPPRA